MRYRFNLDEVTIHQKGRTWRHRAANVADMADPVTLAVAAGIAGKATEALAGRGEHTIATITRKVRDRFRSRPGDSAVLDAALADSAATVALASVLDREFARDPKFRQEIEALWQQAAPVPTVTNVNYGTPGTLIQAGHIGDLTIN
jgi:hypothetical protein